MDEFAQTFANLYDSRVCDRFDGFLGGALRCGEITEIVGQSASGKTQVLYVPVAM